MKILSDTIFFQVKKVAKENINRPAQQIVDDVMLESIEPQDHQLPKVNNLKRLANRVRANMRPQEPTNLDFEVGIKLFFYNNNNNFNQK